MLGDARITAYLQILHGRVHSPPHPRLEPCMGTLRRNQLALTISIQVDVIEPFTCSEENVHIPTGRRLFLI